MGSGKNHTSSLLSLIKHAEKFRPQWIIATVYSVINKLFDIAPEILIGMAIDVVVSQENSFLSRFGYSDPWHQIIILSILTFFIWVGESTFEYLYMICWRNLAQNIQHEFRTETYAHMQNLDMSYFEKQNTGNLVAILNDDINQLESFLNGGANSLIQTFTSIVGVGAVFFIISPQIALVAFVPIPIVVLGAFFFQKKAQPLYTQVRSKVGHLSSRLNNNISGILTIKSYTSEKREADSLKDESSQYLAANREAIKVSSAFIPIIRMAILAGFLATFILGGWKVLNNELAVGSYGVLVFLTQRLLWPLTGLATTVDLYERAMASVRRILNLLNTPIKIKAGRLHPKKIEGEIEFCDTSFKYATGPLVLKNLNFVIEPRKTTAFVGPTGSGKSSLIKLILRFYEPTEGKVNLDGENIADYDLVSLRKRIGLVSQDVFLFHGTVEENIAYGNPKASFEQIVEAAKLAEAHDFIENLEDGYNTIVGERGQKLSGGQRQRLSIARALIKNPDILILDEATSAVDNETEAAIQRSLEVISKDRTTIVIAHRLSTIVKAHRIYVLEEGQLTEQGDHNSLLGKNSTYANLWRVQTGL